VADIIEHSLRPAEQRRRTLTKNKRYGDAQIMGILKQAESGVPVSELCREHGMSSASFYEWRANFGGMDTSMISELKAMAEENRRLKRMYADVSMSEMIC